MRRHTLRGITTRSAAALAGATAALAGIATASAQSAIEGASGVGSDVSSFGIGDWVNLAVRLAIVVGVIWGAVHAMRWYVRRMNQGHSRYGTRALEVLETHALGPNRTLHLVRLGERAVLIGSTQERITQLLTVDDAEEFRRLTDVPEADEGDSVRPGAGTRSALASLRTGFQAMRARQSALQERRAALREQQRDRLGARATRRGRPDAGIDAQEMAEAARQTSAPRFGAFKGLLQRSQRPARAARAAEEAAALDPAEARQSLFDRALASIDAIEVMPNAPQSTTAAGARARAMYGQARPSMTAPMTAPMAPSITPPLGGPAGRNRDDQIAELQRAIIAARRNAG